jgi:hypothetical protein
MFKVLSIDGGGIRGVIPAVILQHIEAQKGKPISELFDLIVGTSTGGILAAGLAVRGATAKKPKFTATDMLDLYAKHGSKIFDRSFWRGITSVGGALDETYSHKPLEKLLEKYLEKKTLKDCVVPIVATSYDIERREPYFFKTRRADQPGRNHLLTAAARATSAAPTFFEPAEVKSIGQKPVTRYLIDGGVFVNNPAMCAYVEAIDQMREDGREGEEMLLASLGTGVATRKIPYKDAKGWGALGWVRPVISVMMDGEADAADYQAGMILPDVNKGAKQRYFRFDKPLTKALDDMDAAHAANIEALKEEAGLILSKQSAEMTRLLGLL